MKTGRGNTRSVALIENQKLIGNTVEIEITKKGIEEGNIKNEVETEKGNTKNIEIRIEVETGKENTKNTVEIEKGYQKNKEIKKGNTKNTVEIKIAETESIKNTAKTEIGIDLRYLRCFFLSAEKIVAGEIKSKK